MRALVRDPDKALDLSAQDITLVKGDLQNPTALEQLLKGCDGVIHGAGAVRGANQADFDRVNVAGTAALLAAIHAQPQAPRLLHLSSITAQEPGLSWYAHSKREGEERVKQRPDLDWVIVRPPAVYGPGDKEMLPIFQWMSRGIAVVPGSPEARISLIHVSDLVSALLACLKTPQTHQQVLTLCDGQDNGYNWHDMAGIAAETWSRRVWLWRVPPWLLNSAARVILAIARLTGGAPMLTPPKLRELRHDNWAVDNETITAATGWVPAVSLLQGMQEIRIAAL